MRAPYPPVGVSQDGDQVGLFTLPHLGISNEVAPVRRRQVDCGIRLSVGIIGHRLVEARAVAGAEDHGRFEDIPEFPDVTGSAMPR